MDQYYEFNAIKDTNLARNQTNAKPDHIVKNLFLHWWIYIQIAYQSRRYGTTGYNSNRKCNGEFHIRRINDVKQTFLQRNTEYTDNTEGVIN